MGPFRAGEAGTGRKWPRREGAIRGAVMVSVREARWVTSW